MCHKIATNVSLGVGACVVMFAMVVVSVLLVVVLVVVVLGGALQIERLIQID